jgi:iron-sulfur cluster repair protein YtfE (RIC family)
MEAPHAPFHGVTEYLSWDHDVQEDQLMDARDAVDAGDASGALAHFDGYQRRLTRHMRLEERVLFPLIESLTPHVASAVAEMRLEHTHVVRMLLAARTALAAGDAEEFRRAFDALGLVLLAHEAREERLVYPILDRSLSPEQRVDLAARLAAEP